MFTLKIEMNQDRSSVAVTAPTSTEAMTAAELEQLMRDLALVRANMQPVMPNEPMKPSTLFSVVPCNQWQTGPDPDVPTHIRLCLQHLGFGWVWMSLSEAKVRELQEGLRNALRDRPMIS